MNSEALFAATFVIGKENYTGSEFSYPSLVTYTWRRVSELVEEQGLAHKPINWPHPGPHQWTVIADPSKLEDVPDTCDFSKRLANRMLLRRERWADRWEVDLSGKPRER